MISEAQGAAGGGAADYPGSVHRSSPLLVALAWAVVALPAVWGIYMTARTSVQLFKPTAPAPAAHTTPTTPGLQR
jgi:hypothetical protein